MNQELIKKKLNKMKNKYNCFLLQLKDEVKIKSQRMNKQTFKVETTYIYENKLYSEFELFLNDLSYYYKSIDNYKRFCLDLNNIMEV